MSHKVLFVSNTANFSKFNRPFMRWFRERGWQVDYASAGEEEVADCDNQYALSINRSPFSLQNLRAIKELRELVRREHYRILHCHTPMGAVVSRAAAGTLRQEGLKIIHTAHGFQFCKGASLVRWLCYYPVDRYLSRYEDALITINQEDYDLARKKFMARAVYKIDGVGVNLDTFVPVPAAKKAALRKEYGYDDNDFILIYIAEFIRRKNHLCLLRQIPELKKAIPEVKIIFAGKGVLFDEYQALVNQMGETERVSFLGYRNDVHRLCQISDLHVSPSWQEGQGLNNIEAMASGLPVVCSRIRGHTDVVTTRRNGFLFELREPSSMTDRIITLYKDRELRRVIAQNNIVDAGKYSVDRAVRSMADIYGKYL